MLKYKLHDVVSKILEEDPRCRTDSKWLVYCVWRFYTKIYIPYENFKDIPSPESIVRCRRTVQHKENKFNSEEFVPEEGVTFIKPGKETEGILKQARDDKFTEDEVDLAIRMAKEQSQQ